MPRTEKVYPEWVQRYREKGTTIKKKGDSYYLFKRTSRRDPGKKYPQPVDTYIGIYWSTWSAAKSVKISK